MARHARHNFQRYATGNRGGGAAAAAAAAEEVINYLLKGIRVIKADFTTPCATSPVLSLSRR